MRKNIKSIFAILTIVSLILCGCTTTPTTTEIIVKETPTPAPTSKPTPKKSSSSSSSSSSSYSKPKKYCEASGCTSEGTYSVKGFSGLTEYYCYSHYKEMKDIISDMESSVGKSNASKHTCEVCSKEGTKSMVGLSGQTEYYCTEHYQEMMDLLKMFLN